MPDNDAERILALDRAHVWHPYGAFPGAEPLVVTSASGVRLRLADGRELVDGMSSWWAAIHGYRHPDLDAAVRRQLESMSHVMFGGLTHAPAVELAQRLVEITPAPLQHVFFSDSGSVAVEVAAKMALQFWRARGRPAKHRLITWRGGYHGDTVHPMSVCDPDGGMHAMWTGLLPRQLFVPAPPREYDAAYREVWTRALTERADEIAAIVVEPVVQGAGGMTFHDPAHLTMLRELADEHDVLLIFDEIATGFGRTGALFAAEHADVAPDVLCLGKALTGGYLSMAATLCTTDVASTISGTEPGVLAHGPTFMGNPLAAAVSLASIDLLLGQDWAREVRRIEGGLRTGLDAARGLPGVRDVRVLGAIGVVQLDHPVDVGAATAAAVGHGVWLRPFRDLVYAMPPYVSADADVDAIAQAICAAAALA